MIKITTIAKKKDSATNAATASGGYANSRNTATTVETEIQGVNIWGQYHDHTGDVDGDMTVNGNITASGNMVTDRDMECENLTASDINVNGEITTGTLYVNGTSTFADTINADDITLSGDLSCIDIKSSNIDNSGDVVTKNLTVTGSATFFEVIIDKIKSVGGQVILSAANAKIDKVVTYANDYRLYWKRYDGTDYIENDFQVDDQVLCQTFNKVTSGGSASNKYYWGIVTAKGTINIQLNGESTPCNYINISRTDIDGSGIPAAGDEIVQLGYRGTDDATRQSAIIISSTVSPDTNVEAPSIVQYKNINSYSLDGCIINKIAADGTSLTGDFRVVKGNTTTDILDLITGQQPQVIADSEQAWMMTDSSSKTYYFTDYQNLPTSISVYLGNDIIPYSEWITGSKIKYNNKTINLVGSSIIPAMTFGLRISAITKNTNDCAITWGYEANEVYDPTTQATINKGTAESNKTLEITIVFSHNETTYTATKNVPFNLIKASEVTQGADAEFDKFLVDAFDFTVNEDNALIGNVSARIAHVKGNAITQLTDLTGFSATCQMSDGTAVAMDESTYYSYSGTVSSAYTEMANPPTSVTLKLSKSGTVIDEVTTAITFAPASVLSLTDESITASTQAYNKAAAVELTANGLSTRVTAIEDDYITSSELTQTANNIQLNVYDELKNKTGIDVSAGLITLNGNTNINGNLSITEGDTGFSIVGEGGITQIMPQSIGTYNDFTSKSSTTIYKDGNTWGIETEETDEVIKYTFETDFTVGTVKAGNTISIAPTSRAYYTYAGVQITSSHYTETSKTITIYENGTQKQTARWTTNAVSYTSQGGSISIKTTDNVTIDRSAVGIDEDNVGLPYQIIRISVTLPNDAFMLIGYDGLAVNFGTSATAYIGAESTTVKYGDYGLQITSSGLKKWNGNTWVGVNCRNVKTISANYTLTNDDDLLLYNSSTARTLTLPTKLDTGKVIYIKKLGSANLTLSSATSNIYAQNSTTGATSATVSSYVSLTWTGAHWLIGLLT